ncbi:MAG: hypothetical protein KGN76_09715 [Acidobacteriota bacterium]|nr:hypothetical protein [Acidobacteriota bacterium]
MFTIGQAHEEGCGSRDRTRYARRLLAAVAVVAMAGLLGACAPKTYRAALVQQGALSQAVANLQRAEHDAWQSHMYGQDRHARYTAVIGRLSNNLGTLNDALSHWSSGQPMPAVLHDAIAQLQGIQNDQASLDPPSGGLLAAVQQLVALLNAPAG